MSTAINQEAIIYINLYPMQLAPRVDYLPCPKKGYHFGEVLNMICLEPACQHDLLCCCACVEEQHKDHNAKPLKLVLLEATKAAQSIVPSNFSIDIALQLVNNRHVEAKQNFIKYREEIKQQLDAIEKSIETYFSLISQQVKLKNMNPKVELEKAFSIIRASPPEPNAYLQSIKIVSGLLSVKKEEQVLDQNKIMASIATATEDMTKRLKASLEEVTTAITSYNNLAIEITKNLDLWKEVGYKFKPHLKHPDIKIISDLVVKSTNGSGYKFAIMEPSLEPGSKIKEMAFKINESCSNWVAVGMCHKNIVVSKNYGFNFSAIGHGAYMVSANGGCWNNTKADQNNNLKSFKFGKGAVISVRVDFNAKTAVFKKDKGETYTINFSTIEGDELHPCVLFYYINDEIEFLPNHKF